MPEQVDQERLELLREEKQEIEEEIAKLTEQQDSDPEKWIQGLEEFENLTEFLSAWPEEPLWQFADYYEQTGEMRAADMVRVIARAVKVSSHAYEAQKSAGVREKNTWRQGDNQ